MSKSAMTLLVAGLLAAGVYLVVKKGPAPVPGRDFSASDDDPESWVTWEGGEFGAKVYF